MVTASCSLKVAALKQAIRLERLNLVAKQNRREEFFAKVRACEEGFGIAPSVAEFEQWCLDIMEQKH